MFSTPFVSMTEATFLVTCDPQIAFGPLNGFDARIIFLAESDGGRSLFIRWHAGRELPRQSEPRIPSVSVSLYSFGCVGLGGAFTDSNSLMVPVPLGARWLVFVPHGMYDVDLSAQVV